MKKNIIICTLACMASFCAGWCLSLKWYNIDSLYEANEFKRECLYVADDALLKVDTIMDNNDIYDIDGSDVMSDYLELRCKLDSLYNTQL